LNDTIVWKLDNEDNHGFVCRTSNHADSLAWNFDIYGRLLSQNVHGQHSLNLNYSYDVITGNLISGNSESFLYDEFNRLAKWRNYDVEYDDEGNITQMPINNTLTYDGFKLNSWTSPNTLSITTHTCDFSYLKSIERPYSIQENGKRVEFGYRGNRQRQWMNSYIVVGDSLSLIGTRVYLDEDFEIDKKPGVHLHQIYRDNIGSIVMYAGDFGTYRMAYTPWGARLMSADPAWVLYYPPSSTPSNFRFIRGFGSHEIIPFFGLLNANARIYNPYMGRFLSPDPILAMSGGPLDMNPYVYARNNPLSYVDQDGEFPWLFVAAALFGGVMNVATNWGSISNWKQGLAFFAVGAAAGVGSYLGFSPISSALLGGANSVLSQGFTNGWKNIQWGQVTLAAGSSLVTSVLTKYVGDKINVPITKLTSHISNSVIRGTLNGTLGNAATGFIVGTGMSLVTGNDLKTSLRLGASTAASAGIVGGIEGLTKGIEIRKTGRIQRDNPYYLLQKEKAQMQYPDKAGNYELHHIDPQYMGGDKYGKLVKIDAAYHQIVTNAFREQHPYGVGKIPFDKRQLIMRKIYMKYPLPY